MPAGPRSQRAGDASQTSDLAAPMVLSAIDIGSRALRLAVSEAGFDQLRRLETLSVPVSIGVDTFARGRIRAVTTEAVVRTLNDFLPVLRGYGVDPQRCRTVATTAVRDARNREVFLERVEHGTGLKVSVLEAIEETWLAHQLVRHLLGDTFDRGCHMVLALGAGGVQVIVQKDGENVLAETRRLGLMRLSTQIPENPSSSRTMRSFLRKATGSFGRLHDLTEVDTLVVINTELFVLAEGLARCVRHDYGLELPRRAIGSLSRLVAKKTSEDLVRKTRLDHANVELARSALLHVEVFATLASQARRVVLPASSMLDSLLLDSQIRLGILEQRGTVAARVESAARAVARRYHVDERHAAKVRQLALQLFDGLREHTTLADRSRLLLSVAALLHTVGLFVASRDNERHAAYLIRATQVMGLNRAEIDRVALLARFYRKPVSLQDNSELQHLTSSQRVEVLKLIALLRIAAALDADGRQQIERVAVEMSADALEVRAVTRTGQRGDFVLIERAFRERCDLCEELFGVELRLTEVLAQ